MHHLNRRTLLAAAASLSIARSDTTRADPSIHYDVIVVGGGTAGIPCALFAAKNGARVLLIEKSPALGGTLFWSTGQIDPVLPPRTISDGLKGFASLLVLVWVVLWAPDPVDRSP